MYHTIATTFAYGHPESIKAWVLSVKLVRSSYWNQEFLSNVGVPGLIHRRNELMNSICNSTRNGDEWTLPLVGCTSREHCFVALILRLLRVSSVLSVR